MKKNGWMKILAVTLVFAMLLPLFYRDCGNILDILTGRDSQIGNTEFTFRQTCGRFFLFESAPLYSF